MQLRIESRPVGDVLVVECEGRIMLGEEVDALYSSVTQSLLRYVDIVLQLARVKFIDSSGVGALVRLMRDARSKGGDLKLSAVPPDIFTALSITNLLSQFDTFDSIEEAVTAAYMGPRYSRGSGNTKPTVICVHGSVHVCTFLKEVVYGAGYNALTAGNISEAQVLLRATKAKLVVIPKHLEFVHGQDTRKALGQIDPAIALAVLDENFEKQDPAEALGSLLRAIHDSRRGQASNSS